METASPLLYASFAVIVTGVGGLFLAASRAAPVGTFRPMWPFLAWVAASAGGVGTGLLTFQPIPTLLAFFLLGFVLTIRLARSSFGTHLIETSPLWLLVGYQCFRVPVELFLHRASVEGLAPIRMTYEGMNYDIVTGATAVALGAVLLRRRLPDWVLWVWNIGGLGLLATVVTVAILSTPGPLQVFHDQPTNVWVSAFPWVWLPTVLVPAALFGHALVFRVLMNQRKEAN